MHLPFERRERSVCPLRWCVCFEPAVGEAMRQDALSSDCSVARVLVF